ncbi:MAG TPA: DUF5685 family protein [Candidatus Atribacteria bacterium]|nr:DUF5685 family protein [Candidatus Atribacteria bacterium]HPT77629.1 DUF5685 family protein [Candidatus Atribacteria bacterium]
MFGYIKPDKPEMKIGEFELFRAYYCGLCKCISARYGQAARFILSYDCTFLCLLLSSLGEDDTGLQPGYCITRPFRRIPVIARSSIMEYAAGVNVLLAYHNLIDDLRDKSPRALTALPALYPAYRKAKRRFPQLDKCIKSSLEELRKLEKNHCDSIDMASRPFSELLAAVIAGLDGLDGQDRQRLEQLGYNTGKWLYTIDALDDLEQDMKRGCYNPLVQQYLAGNKALDPALEVIRDQIGFVLRYSLKQVCEAYESLDIKRNRPLLDNIIYGGMYKKTDQVLSKGAGI